MVISSRKFFKEARYRYVVPILFTIVSSSEESVHASCSGTGDGKVYEAVGIEL